MHCCLLNMGNVPLVNLSSYRYTKYMRIEDLLKSVMLMLKLKLYHSKIEAEIHKFFPSIFSFNFEHYYFYA